MATAGRQTTSPSRDSGNAYGESFLSRHCSYIKARPPLNAPSYSTTLFGRIPPSGQPIQAPGGGLSAANGVYRQPTRPRYCSPPKNRFRRYSHSTLSLASINASKPPSPLTTELTRSSIQQLGSPSPRHSGLFAEPLFTSTPSLAKTRGKTKASSCGRSNSESRPKQKSSGY